MHRNRTASPETVVVRSANGLPFARDVDYALDPLWGTIGRLEGGSIGADESVLIEYTWGPARLDAIVMNASGQVRLIEGTPGLGFDPPPAPGVGEYAIGSVWNPGNAPDMTAENLLPVEHSVAEPTLPEYYAAEQFLPKTLAKLEAGEPVTIVAWGDSVTNGGGVGGDTALWYQNQFVDRLRARYPDANITLHTTAWPGRGSRDYLEAPPAASTTSSAMCWIASRSGDRRVGERRLPARRGPHRALHHHPRAPARRGRNSS